MHCDLLETSKIVYFNIHVHVHVPGIITFVGGGDLPAGGRAG